MSLRKLSVPVIVVVLVVAGIAFASLKSSSGGGDDSGGPVSPSDAASNPLAYPVDPRLEVVPTAPIPTSPRSGQGQFAWALDPVTGQPIQVDPSTGAPIQQPDGAGVDNPSGSGAGPDSPATTVPAQQTSRITCKAAFTTMSNGADLRRFATITISGVALVWAEFVEGDRKVVEPVDTRSGFGLAAVPFGMSEPRLTVYGSASLDPASTGCSL